MPNDEKEKILACNNEINECRIINSEEIHYADIPETYDYPREKDIFLVGKDLERKVNNILDRIYSFIVNNKEDIFDNILRLSATLEDIFDKFYILLIKDVFVFLRNQTNLLEYMNLDQLKEIPPIIYNIAKDIFSKEVSISGEEEFLKKISNLKGFIYRTKNPKTNTKYFGQTTRTIEKEWGSILTKAGQLKKKRDETSQSIQGRYIFNAVIKYGKSIWDLKLVDIAYNQTELDEKEIYYIDKYKTNALRYNNPSFGYNMTDGGSGGNHSPATIEKLRESAIKQWQKEGAKEGLSESVKKVWKRDGHKEKMSRIFSEAQNEIWEKLRNGDPKDLEKRLKILSKTQENRIIPIDKKQFLVDVKNSMKREEMENYNMSGITISRNIKQCLGAFGVNNYKSAKVFLNDRDVDEVFKYLDNPEGYNTFRDPAIKEFFRDVINSTTASDLFSKYGKQNISRTKIPRIVGKFGITTYTELKNFLEEKGLTKSLKYFESVGRICVPKPNLTKIQRLDKIAKDKELTLLSSYDDYKDMHNILKWLCNVCGCEFDGSSDKVKTAKTPCRNCRINLTKIQRLDKIAQDKDLTLLSSYDDYKNLDTELKWLCNVCGCEFDGSSDKVKTARTPCRNCRSFISKRHY